MEIAFIGRVKRAEEMREISYSDTIVINEESLNPGIRTDTYEIYLTERGEIEGEFFEERGVNPSNIRTSKKRKKVRR